MERVSSNYIENINRKRLKSQNTKFLYLIIALFLGIICYKIFPAFSSLLDSRFFSKETSAPLDTSIEIGEPVDYGPKFQKEHPLEDLNRIKSNIESLEKETFSIESSLSRDLYTDLNLNVFFGKDLFD